MQIIIHLGSAIVSLFLLTGFLSILNAGWFILTVIIIALPLLGLGIFLGSVEQIRKVKKRDLFKPLIPLRFIIIFYLFAIILFYFWFIVFETLHTNACKLPVLLQIFVSLLGELFGYGYNAGCRPDQPLNF